MKDFLKDELSITQKFAISVANLFRRIRYGIAPCREGCCEELQGVRFELLQWQRLKDDYDFTNLLNAGPDRTIQLPLTTTLLNALYTSLSQPAAILWTQVSGTAATLTTPTSLVTGVTGLTSIGNYEFEISVTDPSGSVLTDRIILTVTEAATATILVEWGFSLTNPLASITAGDVWDLQYERDILLTDTSYVGLDFTNQANERYLILREPATASVKTVWNNTTFNFGVIPDQVFLDPVIVGPYRYYISRIPVFLGVGTTKITFQ